MKKILLIFLFILFTVTGVQAQGCPYSFPLCALPLENDAATPTLAFGDGDTGFYESADDTLIISAGGTARFSISGGLVGMETDLTINSGAGNTDLFIDTNGAGTYAGMVFRNNSSVNQTMFRYSEDDDNLYISDGAGTTHWVTIDNAGNVGIGTTSPQGNVQISSTNTHGGYITKVYEATSGTLTGATDKIELDIPTNWVIEACQLHVKTAVVTAGDNTWSSELNDGSQEEVISAGSAAAQNTNVTHHASADSAYGGTLTNAETDILLTPNGASFTSGEIEAHCIALGFDTWDNE